MNISWDNIKYIFQVPIQWYKNISNRVFNAYGTNFINVREGYYGGAEIAVDEDAFSDAVNRAVELSGYVTIDTDQTITGEKTFTSPIVATNGTYAAQLGWNGATFELSSTRTVAVKHPTTNSQLQFNPAGAIELYTGPTSIYGGYIDFHTTGSSADYTSRIIDSTNMIQIIGAQKNVQLYTTGLSNEIQFNAPVNKTVLQNQPTDTSTNSLAVATVGYCQDKFGKVKTVNNVSPDSNGNVSITIPQQIVKTVDHHSPDSSGNIQLNAICTINGHNGDSVGNFAGVVTSVNSNTPDLNGNVSLTGYVTQSELTDYVTQDELTDYVTQNELTDYVTQNELTGYATQQDVDDVIDAIEQELTAYVQSVDGHTPTNGAIDFGLTGSKFVKTDSNGHLTTTNDKVVTVSSNDNLITGTRQVVTNVSWNGTQIVIASQTWTFTNGVLTNTVNNSNATINTLTYNP